MLKTMTKSIGRIKFISFFFIIISCNCLLIFQCQTPIFSEKREDILKKNTLRGSNSFYYSLDWYRHWSGSGQQHGKGIAVDSNNNIYQTGYTDMGPYGGWDAILIKRSSSGILLWNRTLGGSGNDIGLKVEVDYSDNVYVIHNNNLTKFDKHGSLQWSKTIGSSVQSIVIDSENYIYVVGYRGSPSDIVLAKFNNSGIQLLENVWNTSSSDEGIDLAVDSLNNIYIAGSSSSVGSIVIKCNTSGDQILNFTWQGNPKAISVDSNSSIYLGGDLSGSIFTVKFNNSGGYIWNRTWVGTGGTYCKDLALDSKGNIFLTGIMYGSIIYAYILAYDSSGNLIWTTTWGGDFPLTGGENIGWGIVLDSFDNLYISGYSTFINWINYESFLLKYVYGSLPQPFSLFSDADAPDIDGRFSLFWDPSIGAKNYSLYTYSYYITEINNSLILLANQSAISPYPISVSNGTFHYILVAHNETGNRRSNCISVYVEIPHNAQAAPNDFNIILLVIIIIIVFMGVSGILTSRRIIKRRVKIKPKRFKIEKERVIYIKKQLLEIGTKFNRLQITEIAEICEEDSKLVTSIIKEMIKEDEIYAEYFESTNTVNFDQQTIINEIDNLMATYKEWEIDKDKKK